MDLFKPILKVCTTLSLMKIVRNLFNANFFPQPVHLQENFINLKNEFIKTAFENSELTTHSRNTYMTNMLIAFGSTYLCKAAFSAVVAIKTK